MEGEFKVRAVDFEEKSVAEVEQQLLDEHAEKTGEIVNDEPVDTVVINETTDEPIVENQEIDIDDNKVLSYIGKR
jgi:hypothetical protein